MSYIDIFIPLSIGVIGLLFPDIVIPKQDASYEKKKSFEKRWLFINRCFYYLFLDFIIRK